MIEIGAIIQSTLGGVQDIGLVFEIEELYLDGNENWGDQTYTIFWVCPRPEGKNYITSLHYTEDEIKEAFECGDFEIVG